MVLQSAGRWIISICLPTKSKLLDRAEARIVRDASLMGRNQRTTMEIRTASPELREFISDYLIEQMAPRLRAAGVTGREAAMDCLRAANFGAASTAALVDRALAVAMEVPAKL